MQVSRANLAVFERREFSEFAANVNFSSLRNLASNKLFFTSFISLQQPNFRGIFMTKEELLQIDYLHNFNN